MFNRKIALLTLCIAMPAASFATTQYVAGDHSRATELCISAAKDAPIAFVVKQRESGYSPHFVARNITCNDVSISQFAKQAGNHRNAARIAKFMPYNAKTDILDLSQQQAEKTSQQPEADTLIVVVGH